MSSVEPTRLLLRDTAELDKIAFALRGGRTVTAFIVCPASLRAPALEHLRTHGRTWVIPDPVEPADAAAMHTWLVEAKSKPPREIVCVVIPQAGGPVLNALNLHREKLREGASKLLFIEGADGLAALRAQGRDAYAFRDIVAYLMGETQAPPVAPGEEPAELIEARERYARAMAEQAEATARLAFQLRARGDYIQAERLLRPALCLFTDEWLQDEGFAWRYADVCYELAAVLDEQGRSAEAARCVERGLGHVGAPVTVEGKHSRLVLLAIVVGPYGRDLRSLRLALAAADDLRGYDVGQAFRSLVDWHARCGDLPKADRYLRQADAVPSRSPFNRAIERGWCANIANARGRFESAELMAREAAELYTRAGASPLWAHETLGDAFFLRGEVDAARRVFTSILQSDADRMRTSFARIRLAHLAIATSDIDEGLEALRAVAKDALDAGADRAHYDAHSALVESLVAVHEAGRLSADELDRAITVLDDAEALSRAAFGTDPPWYTIFFPLRRSELAALRSPADALAMAQTALERAQASCPEMVPEAARVHGQHLIRAGRFEEALTTLALAETAAQQEERLNECASARRWGIVAAVFAGKPIADIEARVTALRETLESSDSPRLKAEQLLDLAGALPAASTVPDPLVLADEALDLFAAMPYPAKQARSMEVAGDVLATRGDAEGARRRYRAALALLERFHLRLRIPRIEAKAGAEGP